MSTKPRAPDEHYREAERLIRATEETPESAPLLALAHAILTLSPRRARRIPQPPAGGLPPRLSWGDQP